MKEKLRPYHTHAILVNHVWYEGVDEGLWEIINVGTEDEMTREYLRLLKAEESRILMCAGDYDDEEDYVAHYSLSELDDYSREHIELGL
jgi:hypothetical protein